MTTLDPTAAPAQVQRSVNPRRIVLGVVSVGIGVTALALPTLTLLVVALLFGVQLVFTGGVRIVHGLRLPTLTGGRRAVLMLLGAITAIAGVICVMHPGAALRVVVWTVAIGWFADGISELAGGIGLRQSPLQRGTLIVFGVSSLIGAGLVLVFPGASLLLFSRIGGVLLLVLGAITLATAVRTRPAPAPLQPGRR